MHITDHVFEETKIAGQSRCVADTHTVVRQFYQPICNHFIFRFELAFVAVTRLTDPEGLASHPNTNPVSLYCSNGHLFASRWPHH